MSRSKSSKKNRRARRHFTPEFKAADAAPGEVTAAFELLFDLMRSIDGTLPRQHVVRALRAKLGGPHALDERGHAAGA